MGVRGKAGLEDTRAVISLLYSVITLRLTEYLNVLSPDKPFLKNVIPYLADPR